MFFWLLLKAISSGIYKHFREWSNWQAEYFLMLGGTVIIFLGLPLFALLDIYYTAMIIVILTLLGYFIFQWIVTFTGFYILDVFNNTVSSLSFKNMFGKHWWFFVKITPYLALNIKDEETLQWLADNISTRDFVLLDKHVYFKNKEDAILFKLSCV